MKHLLIALSFLFITANANAQKDPCDKYFFKERNSSTKSSVFGDNTKTLKTKYCSFFANGNRTVSIAFIQGPGNLKLQFYSQLVSLDGRPLKREVILGQNIKIAFIFEDGTNEIIEFTSSEQKGHLNSSIAYSNQNEIILTKELLNKLSTTKIVSTEMQNPFNVMNSTPVKDREVKAKIQNKIIEVAKCFKGRITRFEDQQKLQKVKSGRELIIVDSISQTFESTFLGEEFQLYKGALFRLMDKTSLGFHYTFYTNLEYCQSGFNNVIYPDPKYTFKTVSDSLANRIFKVEDIVDNNGNSYKDGGPRDKPIFVLKDISTNQLIYYKYDKRYLHNFPFNTSKIELDEEIFCSKIDRSVDDFTDEIRLNSPILSAMTIYKIIDKADTRYHLSLRTYGNTVIVDGSGVIILFTDGVKMTKSVKINVEAKSKGYEYSAFITLTEADLKTLSTKKVNKFRLYIYDENVDSGSADKFKIYVKCIMDAL